MMEEADTASPPAALAPSNPSDFPSLPSSHPVSPSSGGLSLTFRDLTVSTSPSRPVWRRPLDAIQRRLQPASRPAAEAAAAPTVHTKQILRGASGYIPSNSLTALMGGSGQRGVGQQTCCVSCRMMVCVSHGVFNPLVGAYRPSPVAPFLRC